jgi:hypothetical protein
MSCGLAKTSPLPFVVVLQMPRKRSPVLRNCMLSLDTPIIPKLDWFITAAHQPVILHQKLLLKQDAHSLPLSTQKLALTIALASPL